MCRIELLLLKGQSCGIPGGGGGQQLMCSLKCLGSGCVAAGLGSDVNPSRRSLGTLEVNDRSLLRPLLALSVTAGGRDLNVPLMCWAES